jgi:hypothetical protein
MDNAPFPKDRPPPSKRFARVWQPRRFNMIQKTAVEMISRRKMLGILGAGVAFGMGAPAALLTASDAEAQTPGAQPPGAQPPAAQAPGVDQRQSRPDDVTGRRQRHAKRRAARHKAFAERQEGRKRRRMARHPGSTSPKGTGPAGPGTPGTGTTGQGPARQ